MKVRLFVSFFAVVMAVLPAYGQGSSISGTVHNLQGRPVGGAVVYAYDKARVVGRFIRLETRTKADGRFLIKDLFPGSYRVQAYKDADGYPDPFFAFFKINRNAWKDVEVSSTQVSMVALELGPKGARLVVSVRDEAGNPIAASLEFQRVTEREPSYSESIDPDTVVVVPPAPFWLTVSAPHFVPWRSEILKPKSGENFTLKVQLKPSQ